ncbi:bacteriocin, partial [Campylobacter sp. MIT 12-8780]
FLARISKGNLSDYSVGVKKLSLEEMKEVKGGYVVSINDYSKDFSTLKSEIYATAGYTRGEEQYIFNYDINRRLGNILNIPEGLCAIGQDKCSNPSSQRMTQWLQASRGYLDLRPVYIVKRQIKTSNLGTPYVLFTYGVGVKDAHTGQLFQFDKTTSSALLNYNMIIKEISNKYKEIMESKLGGYNPNLF